MRPFKRFKNWLVVVYYACLAFSEEYQNKNDQQEANEPQANQVTLDDALAELEPNLAAQQSEDSEVSAQQQQAALEMLDTIAQGTSEKAAPVGDSKTAAPPPNLRRVKWTRPNLSPFHPFRLQRANQKHNQLRQSFHRASNNRELTALQLSRNRQLVSINPGRLMSRLLKDSRACLSQKLSSTIRARLKVKMRAT